ncbi:MAG: response regulator [Burkholderiales bacterium]
MKVLIVDDHPILHEVLGAVARSVFRDADISFAKNLEEAFARAREGETLDLVLLDLGLPGCAGLDALAEFRAAFPALRTIVVSATEDRVSVLRALELGAIGYVPKTHAPPLIAAALRLISEGGMYVPPQAIGGDADTRAARDATIPLTGRQLDVLRLIVKGMANKEIAQHLRIAKDTVKQHAKAVYAALGIATRSQAARAAERRGIKLD